MSNSDSLDFYGVPANFAPMEARLAEALPMEEDRWQYEPKWDGFRCLVLKRGDVAELRGKSGRRLDRFFPEIVESLRALPFERTVADGELVIEIDERLSFEALQARLHPAESRIRELAALTPARLILFDLLIGPGGAYLLESQLRARRAALEEMARAMNSPAFALTPYTLDARKASSWLTAGYAGTDGVVAKKLDEPYQPGVRATVKVKLRRTADCVVGGFRYATGSRDVGSLLLGLYDENGKLDHVGFSSSISGSERRALTRKLEGLRSPPGFTGRAPGGPSRWSTERSAEWEPLRPELVVEVRFDHVTDGRFRHGARLIRWRPDKAPQDCTMDQLRSPLERAASE